MSLQHHCLGCRQVYPCDASVLLDLVRELTEGLDGLVKRFECYPERGRHLTAQQITENFESWRTWNQPALSVARSLLLFLGENEK